MSTGLDTANIVYFDSFRDDKRLLITENGMLWTVGNNGLVLEKTLQNTKINYAIREESGQSNYSGGLFNLVLSISSNDVVLNNFQVPNTGGWQSWQTIEKDFELIQGSYTLTMNVLGNEFNLNWIEFEFEGPLSNPEISLGDLTLYPNPSKGKIVVKSDIPIDTIEIFSINGKTD